MPILAFALATLLALPTGTRRPSTLQETVEASSFICVGRVSPPVPVDLFERLRPSVRSPTEYLTDPSCVRRVRVERVLKGDAKAETIFVEAWLEASIFDDEIEPDAQCLLFLRPGIVASLPDAERLPIEAALGGIPMLRNVVGLSPVPTRGSDSGWWPGYLDVPDQLLLADPDPSGRERPIGERGLPLRRMEEYIAELVRFDPAQLAVHARVFGKLDFDDDPFDLRILPSGAARLTVGSGKKENVRRYDLDPALWSALREELRELAGASGTTLVDLRKSAAQRSLKVAIEGRTLEFREAASIDASKLTSEQLEALRRCLRAFSSVRGAIDCPTCTDYRPLDQKWSQR